MNPHERVQLKKACRQLNQEIDLTPQLLLKEYADYLQEDKTEIYRILESKDAQKELDKFEEKHTREHYEKNIHYVRVFNMADTLTVRKWMGASIMLPLFMALFASIPLIEPIMPTAGISINNTAVRILLDLLIEIPFALFQACFISVASTMGVCTAGYQLYNAIDNRLLINNYPELKKATDRLEKDKASFKIFKKISLVHKTTNSKPTTLALKK